MAIGGEAWPWGLSYAEPCAWVVSAAGVGQGSIVGGSFNTETEWGQIREIKSTIWIFQAGGNHERPNLF